MKRIFSFITIIGLTVLFFSCEKENDDSEIDVNGESTSLGSSHNIGKDCMSCHKFTAAGSVYKNDRTTKHSGSKVKITTLSNGVGTVLGTYTVDNSGNFYTSSSINYTGGVYVSVTGSSGTKFMSSAITSGACNSCHSGTSTPKVWTE